MRKHVQVMCLPLLGPLVMVLSCTERQSSENVVSKTGPTTPATLPAPAPTHGEVLADVIEDWIGLLETNDLQGASKKWAKDEEARKQLGKLWSNLRECNQQYDYRKWLPEAKKAEAKETFKVGGHAYGFLHTDWVKTSAGWRIGSVWVCR